MQASGYGEFFKNMTATVGSPGPLQVPMAHFGLPYQSVVIGGRVTLLDVIEPSGIEGIEKQSACAHPCSWSHPEAV
jgi:hypothetical protein